MERIMKKPELAEELAARTGFYKKNMREVVDALADIVLENLQTAGVKDDEHSELHIAPGVLICGRRVLAHESINPQDRSTVMTPEKVIPYAEFKPSIRQKLYVRKKKGRK
jgi:nucleoid DNA-binding protein